MKRKTVRNIAIIGGLTTIAYSIIKKKWQRIKESMGNYKPLVKSIRVTEAGQLTEIYTFAWTEEERAKWVHVASIDSIGQVYSERVVEFEHYEDRLLVIDNVNSEDDVPALTTYLYDPYGMVKSLATRDIGGKEKYWDVVLKGNELLELKHEDDADSFYFTWEDGNLTQIDQPAKGKSIKMTYYTQVENHLFPDLNMISQGLSSQLFTSYVLGVRSKNFMRSMVVESEEGQEYYQFSYLCDNHNRPTQILMENTETKAGATVRSSKEYDITYFV